MSPGCAYVAAAAIRYHHQDNKQNRTPGKEEKDEEEESSSRPKPPLVASTQWGLRACQAKTTNRILLPPCPFTVPCSCPLLLPLALSSLAWPPFGTTHLLWLWHFELVPQTLVYFGHWQNGTKTDCCQTANTERKSEE